TGRRATMDRHWLIRRLHSWGGRSALIWRGESWSFSQLCDTSDAWSDQLARHGIKPGDTLAICGDYSPMACALLLSAVLNRNIVGPLAYPTAPRLNRRKELAQGQFAIRIDRNDAWEVRRFDRAASHPLMKERRERGAPGLVLFSAGSTGE